MPPHPAELEAWVDGGARGNPGPAGWGAYIRGPGGTVELKGFLGIATNNVAEYSGLLAALRHALAVGAASLRVFADSELIVRQMKGQYKVRAPGLKPLFEEARRMAKTLQRFDIVHVPREQNRDADRLANLAMDEGSGRAGFRLSPE
jgi:probable phosphoglycerate mutase